MLTSFVILANGTALVLIGFTFLLNWLCTKIQIPNGLREIAVGLAVVSLIAGFLLVLWARQEAAFLNKPGPKQPPSMFKP